jgi:hypothetical protein
MLTRSRPPARSLRDLCSDRAEHIPFTASQAAQVFVTTRILLAGNVPKKGDGQK